MSKAKLTAIFAPAVLSLAVAFGATAILLSNVSPENIPLVLSRVILFSLPLIGSAVGGIFGYLVAVRISSEEEEMQIRKIARNVAMVSFGVLLIFICLAAYFLTTANIQLG